MKYSLPAIAVDEEAFSLVQSKIMTTILNGLEVLRHIPTAIRHGPLAMRGLDLLDLRTEAGILAVKLLHDSIFAMSETGKMIHLNLYYYSQVESGIGEPLLEVPAIAVSYLTPTWVTSVRHFLYQHSLKIHLTESYEPPLRTKNDPYIMDTEHLSRFTTSEKLDINLVRVHLKAILYSTSLQVPTVVLFALFSIDSPPPPDVSSNSHLEEIHLDEFSSLKYLLVLSAWFHNSNFTNSANL